MHVDSSGLKELSGTRSHKQYRKLPPQLGYLASSKSARVELQPILWPGRSPDRTALSRGMRTH